MKTLNYTLFAIITIVSCNLIQKNYRPNALNKELSRKYSARRDSILKETEYGSVYITKDTTTEMYSWLEDESIDSLIFKELYSWEYISEYLSNNNIRMKHFDSISVEGNWVSLHVLDGSFYVYSPSDWMVNKRILISDSALYHFGSDDWRIESIQNIYEDSQGNLNLNLIDFSGENIELSIKFIGTDKDVALWRRRGSNGNTISELRVRSSNVRKFNMVVNDCLGVKCIQEFEFETPEFLEEVNEIGKADTAIFIDTRRYSLQSNPNSIEEMFRDYYQKNIQSPKHMGDPNQSKLSFLVDTKGQVLEIHVLENVKNACSDDWKINIDQGFIFPQPCLHCEQYTTEYIVTFSDICYCLCEDEDKR